MLLYRVMVQSTLRVDNQSTIPRNIRKHGLIFDQDGGRDIRGIYVAGWGTHLHEFEPAKTCFEAVILAGGRFLLRTLHKW